MTQDQGHGGSAEDSGSGSDSEIDIGEFDFDDAREAKMSGLKTRKKTRREMFDELLELLEGSDLNFLFAKAAFGLASCAVLFGVFSPLEHIEGAYRAFAAVAALFLLSQSFYAVKIVRDEEVGCRANGNNHYPPEMHFLRGALPIEKNTESPRHWSFDKFMNHISALFALGALGTGIWFMDAHDTTKIFIVESILYMLSASLNLAMTLRDRFEKQVWEQEVEGRHIASARVETAVTNVSNTLINHQRQIQVVFFFIAVAAILTIIFGLVFWMEEKDKDKGIGLFTAAMFMCIASSWNMGRVLHGDGGKLEWSVIASFAIAITLAVVGLVEVDWNARHRIIHALAMIIIVDSVFNFAKVQMRLKNINSLTDTVKHKFHLQREDSDGLKRGGGGSTRNLKAEGGH